jgi:hypothetical protein
MPTMLLREFPNDDPEDANYEMPDMLPLVGPAPARKLVSMRGTEDLRLSHAPLQLDIQVRLSPPPLQLYISAAAAPG